MCSPHPLERGARLCEMGAFSSQDIDGGFRHAKSSDARSVSTGAGDKVTRSVVRNPRNFPASWGALRPVPEGARKV